VNGHRASSAPLISYRFCTRSDVVGDTPALVARDWEGENKEKIDGRSVPRRIHCWLEPSLIKAAAFRVQG
jgi:hypothetical protein